MKMGDGRFIEGATNFNKCPGDGCKAGFTKYII